MTGFEDIEDVTPPSQEQIDEATAELKRRCESANIPLEITPSDDEEDDFTIHVSMKNGRDTRKIYLWNFRQLTSLLGVPFEEYRYINRYNAICS